MLLPRRDPGAFQGGKRPAGEICEAFRADNEQDRKEQETGHHVRTVPVILYINVADPVADDGRDAEKADVFLICQITWIHSECPPVHQGHIQ